MSDPTIAQLDPYSVELTAGKPYFFCRCGLSAKQPFCDGAHKDSGTEPLRFTVAESGMFNLCGCKATDDPPYCDGTHNML